MDKISRMPVVFSGHLSPLVALEHNKITEGMEKVGQDIIAGYGKPKAILAVIDYRNLPDASDAVPAPDHYYPLLYCLGAAGESQATVFNKVCNLGSMARTGFVFKD